MNEELKYPTNELINDQSRLLVALKETRSSILQNPIGFLWWKKIDWKAIKDIDADIEERKRILNLFVCEKYPELNGKSYTVTMTKIIL